MNPDQFFNPNKSEVGIIRIHLDWEFSLNHSHLELIRIENVFWIHSGCTISLGLSRIEFRLGLKILDWLGLRRINFELNYIKRDWKLFSDWLGWVRIGADTNFARNRNKSDWFEMNFNAKLLPGNYIFGCLTTCKRRNWLKGIIFVSFSPFFFQCTTPWSEFQNSNSWNKNFHFENQNFIWCTWDVVLGSFQGLITN